MNEPTHRTLPYVNEEEEEGRKWKGWRGREGPHIPYTAQEGKGREGKGLREWQRGMQ